MAAAQKLVQVAEPLKLHTRAQKLTHSKVDTIIFTAEEAESWQLPPFQRDLKINAKLMEVAAEIKADGGMITGILVFGILNGAKYLLDGQHRRKAFLLSECPEGLANVCVQLHG
jgi:hypothetical protein